MTTSYVPSQFTGSPTTTQINAELNRIRDALDHALQRVDATPNTVPQINQMELGLDMNGHEILNVAAGTGPDSLTTLSQVQRLIGQIEISASGVTQGDFSALQAVVNTLGTLVGTGLGGSTITQSLTTIGNSLGSLSSIIAQNTADILELNDNQGGSVSQEDLTALQIQLGALEMDVNAQVLASNNRDLSVDTPVIDVSIPVTAPGFEHIFSVPGSGDTFSELRVGDYVNVRWNQAASPVDAWTQEPQINVLIGTDTVEYGLRSPDDSPLGTGEFFYGETARFEVVSLAEIGVRGTLRIVSNSRVSNIATEKNYSFYGAGDIPDGTKIAGHPLIAGGFLRRIRVYARIPPAPGGATLEILADDVVIATATVPDGGITDVFLDPSIEIQELEWLEIRVVSLNGMADFGIALTINNHLVGA